MPYNVTSLDLERALKALSIPLPKDAESVFFFGVRGAVPKPNASGYMVKLDGSQALNYTSMRCTIGQWFPHKKLESLGEIRAYLGSTVPTLRYVEGSADNGGKGCNQIFPGLYRFTKGTHRAGTRTGHEAFREAGQKLICRTDDDGLYEPETDDVMLDSPADNLHAAWGTESYSSAGCQVVSGTPGSGSWATFKQAGYASAQDVYRYLMLPSGFFVQLITAGEPAICIGSVGDRAKAVQSALVERGLLAEGDEDGIFGPKSGLALLRFQRQRSELAADAICSVNDAQVLKIKGW